VTATSTVVTDRTTEERAARLARLAWIVALSASVLLPVLRFALAARGHGLPPLVACWFGLLAVLGAGVYAALTYARGEPRRAALAALAVLTLVIYVATVLPTNPAECAAYLQRLGPG
jgi:uncharacterized membrane protein